MEKKLTRAQLEQVVAEVTRLVEVQDEELDRKQVIEILNDLNLPSELLDDAMLQLKRREEVAKVRNKQRLIGVAIVLLIGITGFFLVTSVSHHSKELDQITAETPRITLALDSGNDLTVVKASGEEVVMRAKLRNVPMNERLSLRTDWVDPSGKVFKQNSWETKAVDKQIWETHSKCVIGDSAMKGKWSVRLYLSRRLLAERTFVVE